MKVLDLPDEQDNPIRKILLKQDDNTLEELAKKPKQEIQTFLIQAKESTTTVIKIEESRKQNEGNNSIEQDNQYIEQKLSKIKSVFSPKILDKNHDIAEQFKLADSLKDPSKKDEALQSILTTLKDPKRLKAITDQL